MKKKFEPIEQPFAGTPEELRDFIYAYLVRHPESLQVTPSFDDRLQDVYFVERVETRLGRHPAGKVRVIDADGRISYEKTNASERTEYLANPPCEGTIGIKPAEIPIPKTSMVDPNCAAFTCWPLTEDCKRLALAIAEDIKRKGYDLPGGHIAPSTPKMGRPHKKDDDWASAQVNVFGHSKAEIYPLWLARIEDDPERRKMKEPKKHFDRITKPDRGD